MMKSNATRNDGIISPNSDKTSIALPIQPPRSALKTPNSSPSDTQTSMTPVMIDSVTPRRGLSIDRTRSLVRYDAPRSPLKALPSHDAYWIKTDRSSPRSWRSARYCSCVPSAPNIVRARSLGDRLFRTNDTSVTISNSGIDSRSRVRIVASIPSPPLLVFNRRWLIDCAAQEQLADVG